MQPRLDLDIGREQPVEVALDVIADQRAKPGQPLGRGEAQMREMVHAQDG